jgi:hypothetical protein
MDNIQGMFAYHFQHLHLLRGQAKQLFGLLLERTIVFLYTWAVVM